MDTPAYTPEDAPVPEGEVVIERASSSIDVAPKLNRKTADLVRFLMEQGEMVTATQSLTDDMIELFACLLYTSPSPRDVEESRMPSSA